MARKARIEPAFPPEFFAANAASVIAVAASAVAADPRNQNCKGYTTDAVGNVTGVLLTIRPVIGSKYEVVGVELIPETLAQGQTVAYCSVQDKNGVPTSQMVRLAWEPIPGTNLFKFSGPPGNLDNKHIITNSYDPLVKRGPLNLFAGTDSDASQSDIIEGLGLPYAHHVSFRATWREKGGVVVPPVDPPPTPIPGRPVHRLGVHLINSAERDLNYIQQLSPAMVRYVNPDPGVVRRILATTPSYTLVNLRDHLLSEEKAQAAADPNGTAIRHANWWIEQLTTGRFKEFSGNKRIVVVGINEPGVHNLAEELGVYTYNKAFLERLTSAGIRGMALSLSVGWPRNSGGTTPVLWDTFRPLEPVINAGDHLLNLQSYYYPTPQTNWEWYMNRVASCPMQVKIVMAEIGYTRQLAQLSQPWGWRGNISAQQYANDLWYCADNVDPRVVALCPFTSGFGGAEWESKDVTQELITEILQHKHGYSWPTVPVPPTAGDPKLLVLPKMENITNFFGQLYSGYSHSGVDVSAMAGTPIYCPMDATVAWVGTAQEASPYGLYVRVSLPIGIDVLFAHNREVLVKQGQTVKQGQIMAYSDSTGNSTGNHIHMEFRQKDTVTGGYKTGVSSHVNASIDPFAFIAGWVGAGNKVEFRGQPPLQRQQQAQPQAQADVSYSVQFDVPYDDYDGQLDFHPEAG